MINFIKINYDFNFIIKSFYSLVGITRRQQIYLNQFISFQFINNRVQRADAALTVGTSDWIYEYAWDLHWQHNNGNFIVYCIIISHYIDF